MDDDESLQRALQDLIESDGLSARCFGSAEQFLESTARHEAACLIADIRMPGMSGLDLQAKLKRERCRIPIIFITALPAPNSDVYGLIETLPAEELGVMTFDTDLFMTLIY